MYYDVLAERVRFFKESKEGVSIMCKVMEDMRNQAALERVRTVVYRMLSDGVLSLEKIAEYAELSLEEVKKLQAEQHA
jgi:predicted HTH domain antitoxin